MTGEPGKAQVSQVSGLLFMVGQLTDAHRKAKDLYLDRLAPDYKLFDFIEPDEVRLSKILAWFLDPRATHGQGSRFLSLFLEALGVSAIVGDWATIEVRTEFWIMGGRVDILVRTASFQLAIENKPWARDQDQQLTRYFAHFDGSGLPEYRLLYLTPTGTLPSSDSISEQERERRINAHQLQEWSYGDILAWLAKCRIVCRADRVSVFIDEFSRYIRAEFEGVRDRTMTDHLLEEIVSSADRVSAAMQIISLAEDIRKRLLRKLQEQLRNKLTNQNVQLEDEAGSRFSGFTIPYSEQSPYAFGLEFQNSQFNGLIIGVYRKVENSQARGDERASLVTRFGEGAGPDDWWLWKKPASPSDSLLPVAPNWSRSMDPWIEIAQGGLASKIAEAFTRTREVLSECGVG